MRMTFSQVIVAVALLLLVLAYAGAQTTAARRQLDQAVAIEDPNERIAALKDFISQSPDNELKSAAHEQIVLSWAQLGERQLAGNNIGPAFEAFRKALGELPEKLSDSFFEETVARMPFVMSARGYRTEAIELAQLIEAKVAKDPLRLGALGEFFINLEAPGEAIRVLEAAVKSKPDEVRLRRPLAAAYRMSLRLTDAANELQQIAALDSSDTRSYGELGNLARSRGDYAEAIRLYRSQLRADEKAISAMKGIALCLLATGKEDEAKTQLDRILELKGQSEIERDLHFQTQVAFYYLTRGKTDQAAESAVRALTIEPRYSWARIAAAEVEMAAGQPFEAEKHLLSALRNADFPTLRFTLGKLYLMVEDFDGALEQFNRVLTLTNANKFQARLGGVLDLEAESINELLARERQAAIFVASPPTTGEQFAMAEALVRFDARLRDLTAGPTAVSATPAAPRRGRAVREVPATVDALATSFIEAEGVRRAFRALYAARRLAQAGQSLQFVLKLCDQVLDMAEVATESDGSLREFPNLDREARLRILRGRALDTKGWALFQLKRNKEAMTALAEAIESFGGIAEAKTTIWRLATVRETVGEEQEALILYLAAYEPPAESGSVDIKRTLIEVLYRKVHGSLDGLDEKIGPAPRVANVSRKSIVEPRPKEGASGNAIVELPTIGDERSLIPARVNPIMAGARSASLFLVKVSAPKPASIGRPITLVETQTAETVRLVTRRMNTKLLRFPEIDLSEPPPLPIVLPTAPETLIEIEQREGPKLALRRPNSRLLRWSGLTGVERAPQPTAVGFVPEPAVEKGPATAAPMVLIEIEQREAPRLAVRRPNARLLRSPSVTDSGRAVEPSAVALVPESAPDKEAPVTGSRPRTVVGTRPRVTSGSTEGAGGATESSTRSRRVEKPSQPEL